MTKICAEKKSENQKDNVIPFPVEKRSTNQTKRWQVGNEDNEVIIKQVSSGFGESSYDLNMKMIA
ncbi:hypothetical protein [Chengkuizengella axinellae]|uniref:Uncharacterized protein n=1 Tax=Chengkuizengella axinellae TaxID=3064388 RepID=A0ABT9J198_9BACL|nr:hypothetical protein [Chengkuizengella sp. 2205SS18-9]MDP5275394.1 hypothetical protein [Chengkuizengella sp. 2205SS18-9]